MGLNGDFEDAVAIGGWPMDDHPPGGFDAVDLPPCVQVKTPVFNIPYRSLYSRNVENLMLGGRVISATHAALHKHPRDGDVRRRRRTTVGTAAALCAKHECLRATSTATRPSSTNCSRRCCATTNRSSAARNEDPADLARKATATASGETEDGKAANVLNGFVRDVPGRVRESLDYGNDRDGAWLELAWKEPQKIGEVQLCLSTPASSAS